MDSINEANSGALETLREKLATKEGEYTTAIEERDAMTAEKDELQE